MEKKRLTVWSELSGATNLAAVACRYGAVAGDISTRTEKIRFSVAWKAPMPII